MSIKDEKRKYYKTMRSRLIGKAQHDDEICEMLLNSVLYINASAIFYYAALDDEIATQKIILQALSDGKRVSLPVCINDEGLMKFYTITSLDDLKEGCFSIMEPDTDKCKVDTDFGDAICIVPALSYDRSGHRLGYGKGYYDRFLKNFTSFSIGLCYNTFIAADLPVDYFDKAVDFIVTEDNILTT